MANSIELHSLKDCCIFCMETAQSSKSEEHIIPESLGNTQHVLPPGIVCDKCNNYFAIKVEKPVLDSEYFTHSRSRNAIPNKKGRIPPLEIIYGPNAEELGIYTERTGERGIYPLDEKSAESFTNHILTKNKGAFYIPQPPPPDIQMVSRFLSKMALEILAFRFYPTPGWREEILRVELNEIRNYARQGGNITWPYYERRIYEEGKRRKGKNGPDYETLHEFDLLFTTQQELYALIVIFGVEYTINLGGPEIEGYEKWLKDNNYQSHLYMGKNLNV